MTAQPMVKDPAGPWAPAVAGHLRWVHGMLSGVDLLAEHRDALRSRLWAVRSRADDPELRVAVFGETSSGKSTLLNAFLRRRLLPSSARVTTRTTTVLRHREDAEGLTVRTDEDVVLTWPSQSFDDWAGRTPGTDGRRLEDALHRVLTTDLADRVRGLHVLTDVALLGGDVTVIDTPGFSVTDAGHRELAEEAARQADVALVVVPAVAALSMTLVDFLTGPLRDHHDRCAFVLTKLDLLDEDEHPETVEVVTHRLRELGFADPVLLPCAPGRALTEALAAPPADAAAPRPGPGGPGHLAPFLDVEAEIVRLAADRRRSAVAATVYGLLSDLLAAVEETTDSRRAELTRSRAELAALTLPDFTEFLDGWAGRARGRVGSDPLLTASPDVLAVLVNRLVDADVVRGALEAEEHGDLALAVPDELYREVILPHGDRLPSVGFRQTDVVVPGKDFACRAWLHVPRLAPARDAGTEPVIWGHSPGRTALREFVVPALGAAHLAATVISRSATLREWVLPGADGPGPAHAASDARFDEDGGPGEGGPGEGPDDGHRADAQGGDAQHRPDPHHAGHEGQGEHEGHEGHPSDAHHATPHHPDPHDPGAHLPDPHDPGPYHLDPDPHDPHHPDSHHPDPYHLDPHHPGGHGHDVGDGHDGHLYLHHHDGY
ncbi:dynamin family protein [Streptomyces sp. NPDC059515]|uniref:dynamin family protein n=1 Tax=Streptomyces sp. NPDC059515 TaxID=3346854 RepID=UPI00367C609D